MQNVYNNRKLSLLALAAVSVIGLSSCGSSGGGGGGLSFGSGSLAWAAPTTREDGSTGISSGEIDSYRVLYGGVSGDYFDEFTVDSLNASVVLDSIPVGTYFAVVTAIDTDGRESLFSDEITVTIQ